jgi:integrase
MPRLKLTVVVIPNLAPGEYYDTIALGLVLRVGKRRRKWDGRYYEGGAYKREPLGYSPGMGLHEARDALRRMIERVDRGLPVEPAAPHPRSDGVLTLGHLLDQYEAMRVREGRRIKALPKVMRLMRLHLKPHLSSPAAQFDKASLRAIRNELVVKGTPAAASRLLAALGPALRWAAEEDLIETNITPSIRRIPGVKRTRILSKAEFKAIWIAASLLDNTEVAISYGRLVRFLLATAQRRDEVASLRYGHILDGVWRQTENKASRPHSLPLPPLALALVGHGEARDLVFPGRSGGKLAAFSTLKRQLDKASGVKDWVLHDLRRTAASNLQELKIRDETIRAVLNHAIGGTAGTYLRAELEAQKAEALAAWAAEIARIVGPLRVSA